MNTELEQNNFRVVRNFLTSKEAAQLAEAFFTAREENKLVLDPQCPGCPSGYNLHACVKQLVKKVPIVSELCGEDVLPTYVYGRMYTHGAYLNRHRDRHACEVTLTVNLQQDPVNWPIWFQKPTGEEVAVELNPGDAVMYLGMVTDHWRNPFGGVLHTQAFFHYVRADGPCAFAVFDRERRF